MRDPEKEILKSAAKIIERKLKGGDGEVKIPGFGKFYLSRVKWTDKNTGNYGTVNTVRFKPFQALKGAVGDRRVEGGHDQCSGNFAAGGKSLKYEPETTVRTGAPVVSIHSAPRR